MRFTNNMANKWATIICYVLQKQALNDSRRTSQQEGKKAKLIMSNRVVQQMGASSNREKKLLIQFGLMAVRIRVRCEYARMLAVAIMATARGIDLSKCTYTETANAICLNFCTHTNTLSHTLNHKMWVSKSCRAHAIWIAEHAGHGITRPETELSYKKSIVLCMLRT